MLGRAEIFGEQRHKKNQFSLKEGSVLSQLVFLSVPQAISIQLQIGLELVSIWLIAMISQTMLQLTGSIGAIISMMYAMTLAHSSAATIVQSRIIGKWGNRSSGRFAASIHIVTFLITSLISVGIIMMRQQFYDLLNIVHTDRQFADYFIILICVAFVIKSAVYNMLALLTANGHIAKSSLLNGIISTLQPILLLVLYLTIEFDLINAQESVIITIASATFLLPFAVAFVMLLPASRRHNLFNFSIKFSTLQVYGKAYLSTFGPIFINAIYTPIVMTTLAIFVSRTGPSGAEGMAFILKIQPALLASFFAVQNTLGMGVAQNDAAQNHERVMLYFRRACELSVLFYLLVQLLILGYVALSNGGSSTQNSGWITLYLYIVPFSLAFSFWGSFAVQTSHAIKQQRNAVFMAASRFLVIICSISLAAFFYGAQAVFLGLMVGNILSGLALVFMTYGGLKRKQ